MGVLKRKQGIFLIVVTCLMYAVAYLGRLSYAANKIAIGESLGVMETALRGLVESFLFFAYGLGQVLNVFLARWYHPKFAVTIGMLVTGACNFLMTVVTDLSAMNVIWMINGAAQSVFWCNLLNVQSKFLSKKQIGACIITNGFSYCFGTCAIYGLSAIFIAINWRITFYIVSALSLAIAALWFFTVHSAERAEKVPDPDEIRVLETDEPAQENKTKLITPYFALILCFALLVAVVNSGVRDGSITYMPTLMNESFGMDMSLANVVVVGLAIISMFGVFAAKAVTKKIRGYLIVQGVTLVLISAVLFASLFAYRSRATVAFVLLFAVVTCLIYGVSNIVTSLIPFGMKKYANVGGISALLDAFCYVGSTVATYAFGALRDAHGWQAVLILITALSLACGVITIVGGLLARKNPITKEVF